MWTLYQSVIAVLMVVTGSINTLSVKWVDMTKALNKNGTMEEFNHPFLQSSVMFIGETACLFAFYFSMLYMKWKNRSGGGEAAVDSSNTGDVSEETTGHKFSPFILLPPALCDVTGTSVMYIALTLTSASSFQMLRGSIMIFVGIFTVIFLKTKLQWYKWLGMCIIVIGLIIVGLSDMLQNKPSEDGGFSNELIGDILVISAQIVVAVQLVYEEKFIKKHNIPPLKVVGLEGVFGLISITILMIIFSFIKVDKQWGHGPDNLLEDPIDGLIQIGNSWKVALGLTITLISIAFFNFAGVSITKELSAATRQVLDTLRTLFIWAFSLMLNWQSFHYLQPIGFVFLVVGMMIYNNVIIVPFIKKMLNKRNS